MTQGLGLSDVARAFTQSVSYVRTPAWEIILATVLDVATSETSEASRTNQSALNYKSQTLNRGSGKMVRWELYFSNRP